MRNGAGGRIGRSPLLWKIQNHTSKHGVCLKECGVRFKMVPGMVYNPVLRSSHSEGDARNRGFTSAAAQHRYMQRK